MRASFQAPSLSSGLLPLIVRIVLNERPINPLSCFHLAASELQAIIMSFQLSSSETNTTQEYKCFLSMRAGMDSPNVVSSTVERISSIVSIKSAKQQILHLQARCYMPLMNSVQCHVVTIPTPFPTILYVG